MPTLTHPLIERFLEALWLEKGLSAHTQAAYRSDLEHFNAWLDARGLALQHIGRDAILDHLAWRLEQVIRRAPRRAFSRGFAVSTVSCCVKC